MQTLGDSSPPMIAHVRFRTSRKTSFISLALLPIALSGGVHFELDDCHFLVMQDSLLSVLRTYMKAPLLLKRAQRPCCPSHLLYFDKANWISNGRAS